MRKFQYLSAILAILLVTALLSVPPALAAYSGDLPFTVEMPLPADPESKDWVDEAPLPAEETEIPPEEESEQKPEEEPEEELKQFDEDFLLPEKPKKLINKVEDDPDLWLSIDEETFLIYAKYFRDELGLNDAAIAALMANIQQESGFNTNKVGDSGFAYGLMQWRGPRLDALVEFCLEEGLNPISVEGQLAYMKWELTGSYKYAYDLLLAAPDTSVGADIATYDFCYYYLAPANIDASIPMCQKLAVQLIYPTLYELWDAGKY